MLSLASHLEPEKLADLSDEEIHKRLYNCDDERSFVIYEALKRGIAPEKSPITKIDNWFLYKLLNLIKMERSLADGELTDEKYLAAKKYGFLDETIEQLSGQTIKNPRFAAYKMVDTCSRRILRQKPCIFIPPTMMRTRRSCLSRHNTGKKKVVVFGSGPIRIGQGIELTTARFTVSGR